MSNSQILERIHANQTADSHALAEIFLEKLTDELEDNQAMASKLAQFVTNSKGFSFETRKLATGVLSYKNLLNDMGSLASPPPEDLRPGLVLPGDNSIDFDF